MTGPSNWVEKEEASSPTRGGEGEVLRTVVFTGTVQVLMRDQGGVPRALRYSSDQHSTDSPVFPGPPW